MKSSSPLRADRGRSIEVLESRIAPANFALPNGAGPYALTVDALDGHIVITDGVGTEIFDMGTTPEADLFITGGGPNDALRITNAAAALQLAGTLSVNIPGPIEVAAPITVGTALAITSSAANVQFSSTVSLGAADATLSAGRSIIMTGSLTTDSGDISLSANTAGLAAGNFRGINLSAGTITTTGPGSIQLLGNGGDNLGNNVGVALENGAKIRSTSPLASAGSIIIGGNGGPGGQSDNHGVFLSGIGTEITTVRGPISIVGDGGGSSSGNNIGVLLSNGASITSTGAGPGVGGITITGQGDGGSVGNHGIHLDGLVAQVLVRSEGGPITLDGTGDQNVGAAGRGVFVDSNAQVVAGGPGSSVSITGTGTGGEFGAELAGGGPRLLSLGGGGVTVIADSFDASATSSIDAGTGVVTIRPETANTPIELGAPNAVGKLALSGGELSRLAGSLVQIGSNTGAAISIVSPITVTAPLALASSATISGNQAITAPSVNANTLASIELTLAGGLFSGSGQSIVLNATSDVTLRNVSGGGPGLTLATGTFLLGGTDALKSGEPLAVLGTLQLNGFNQTVGLFTGTGLVSNPLSALSTFTVGLDGTIGTFSGNLTGNLRLVKTGNNVQILSGVHDAAAGTSILGGTLRYTALGPALNNSFIIDDGRLEYDLPAPTQVLNSNFTLTGDARLDVAAGKSVTITGPLSGPGSLTKGGAGTLILQSGQSTFGPGPVKIAGGVLAIDKDGALGDPGNDVEIDNATLRTTGSFISARNVSRVAGTATIEAQVPTLTLINKAIVPADLTLTTVTNVAFAIAYADTQTPSPGENFIEVGNTKVAVTGGGTLVVHRDPNNLNIIEAVELSNPTSKTNLVITAINPNVPTTVYRIFIDNPATGTTPADIASINSITLGKNVLLGDGVADSVPDLYVEGKVGKLNLFDINPNAYLRLGDGLLYNVTADKKTPDTYNNLPDLKIRNVAAGVVIDLTPSDLIENPSDPPTQQRPIGGGGLGKVVVEKWNGAGGIRTTQSLKSFKLNQGDCFVVFHIDKDSVGNGNTANCGSMIIQNGAWGSSGNEIEGNIGQFSANEFLAGATLTCASMGRFNLDAGGFAGLLRTTNADAAGIPTFTVNGDFSGSVSSAAPMRKLRIKGDFTGELTASFIGSISAYSFSGADALNPNEIVATDGSIGTLTATFGPVTNFTVISDRVFNGFNVRLGKLTSSTVGLDNVQIKAAAIGNITVSLAAAAGAAGLDLVGIRNSEFITSGNGTGSAAGSIGNITVTIAGVTGGATGKGIAGSSFDALVEENEFGSNLASTANAVGKIAVRVTGQGGASVGLENVAFAANNIGTTTVTVNKGAGLAASARAATGVDYEASGAVGAMSFDGDATVTQVNDLQVAAGGRVGNVTVKAKTPALGSIAASSILAGQSLSLAAPTAPELLTALANASLGAVNVTGSISATQLVAGGSIGAITAGQSLSGSLLLAGARLGADGALGGAPGPAEDSFHRAASIAAITVRGALSTTSIIAGVKSSDPIFGDADDEGAAAAGLLPNTSSIGAITIGSAGASAVSNGTPHQFAIQAAAIKSLKIGAAAAITTFPSALTLNTSAIAPGEDSADVLVRLV